MRSLQYEEATMILRKDKNNYWYAYITVPIPLRKILKKKQLTKSLGTSDKRIAKSRLRETEAVLFQKLDEGNFINHPLVKSAQAFNEQLTGTANEKPISIEWKPEDWFDRVKRFQLYDELLQEYGRSNQPETAVTRKLDPETRELILDENGKPIDVTVTWDQILAGHPMEGWDKDKHLSDDGFIRYFKDAKKHKITKEALKETFVEEFHKISTEQYAPAKRSRTLASVIDEYLKSVAFKEIERKNLKTAVEYESKIKVFSTWAGNITLDDITHKLGNDFVNELISEDSIIVEGGVANSTLIKYMTAVKNLWQWCLDEETVPEKLWGNLKTKGKGKIPVKRRSLSHAELTKLFSIDHNKEDRLLLTCLATTGARFEEIAQLKWKHIKTWEDGSIYIDLKLGAVGTENDNDLMLKNKNSPREIPLLDQVVEQLPERPTDDEQKVFSYKTNRYKKHGQINKKLNRLIKREVIDDPSVVLHSLRHSFKTLFRATSNDYELGEFILGHQGAGNTSSTYGESHALPQKKENPL